MNGSPPQISAAAILVVLAIGGAVAVVLSESDPVTTSSDPDPAGEPTPETRDGAPTSTRAAQSAARTPGGRRRVDSGAGENREIAEPETPELPPLRIETLLVAKGETRRLSSKRAVHVTGDIRIEGKLEATRTVLVLDGGNQLIEGRFAAQSIVLTGGTKRLRGAVGSTQVAPSQPGLAGLYVDENTTLVIEPDSTWTIPNPYGFQVAGHLVIDGGTFACRFSNGNGKDRGEMSWLPGSSLTIHSGKFHGRGDADFGGATVTIYDGELAVDDDLWNTGDTLNVYGGVVRNAVRGGAFGIKGTLNMSAGRLLVHQTHIRGLQIHDSATISCSGGAIIVRGKDASHARGGVLLGRSVTLANLDIESNSKIRADTPPTAYLAVTGRLHIAKDKTFSARGRQVLSSFESDETTGRLLLE